MSKKAIKLSVESGSVEDIMNGLKGKYPMLSSYISFSGISQDGLDANSYTVGCIHTSSALTPVIMDLVMELSVLKLSSTAE